MNPELFFESLKVREGESPRDRAKRLDAERIMGSMKQAASDYRARLDERKNANAEFQRLSAMSQDERMIQAKERMIKARKEYNDFKFATDTTWSQAEKDVSSLIQRFNRDRGWE